MPSLPVYVASDAHLGAAPPAMERAFHDWLEYAAREAGRIILNGDVFDFWFEWGSVIPQGHTRVLGTLAGIVDSGVEVHLFGGNHDWWAGRFLTDEIGVRFHPEPARLELAGRPTLIAHGDGLGAGDVGYRVLRSVLRSQPARWGFKWLHPDVGTWIARRVSRTNVPAPNLEAHRRRAKELERWARDQLLDDDTLELVLLGHSHHPAVVEVGSGRFYVNSGDWLQHGTYVVLNEGEPPHLERWDRS